jgi:uncharacterized membrane protein
VPPGKMVTRRCRSDRVAIGRMSRTGEYSVPMSKGRLEAFSDGVFAVIITIMVLELKAPHESDWAAFRPLLPVFLTYVLSYVFLGIYWNNHHHLMHASDRINGAVLWANLHLLFWLSLVPFVTGWMGENHFAALPTSIYGGVLFMAGIAFVVLEGQLLRAGNPRLAAAIGRDVKGRISAGLYLAAIPLAFVHQLIADVIYVAVALMWLVPDRRIERRMGSEGAEAMGSHEKR